MKRNKFLLATALVAVLFGCKKQNSEAITDLASDGCRECLTEKYVSPNGQVGVLENGRFDGREFTYTHVDGLNVLEGDILLTDQQLGKIPSTEGTITTLTTRYWPNKTVYYKFATGLDQATKDKFITASNEWKNKLGINFVVRTTQANYINVIKGSGCYSSIGMVGGAQDLSLAAGCSSGNGIHEIGHALGMYHEHTRTDRDTYVRVNTANITSGYSHNFTKCSSCTANGTLDFGSIMMYDSYAFSSNGQPTIVRVNGTTFSSQRSALSANDIAIVRSKYP